MKKKNKLLMMVLALIMVLSPAMAFAESYTIDAFTGEITSGDVSANTKVTLSYECYYDKESAMYVYNIGDTGYNVSCTVAKGMITQDPVQIILPDGLTPYLYKDGIIVENADLSNITDIGAYSLTVSTSGTTISGVLIFYIVGAYVGSLTSYVLPTGLEFTSVYKDGQLISQSGDTLSLQDEGEYVIGTKCTKAGVNYSLTIVVDHTAPVLALAEVNEKGYANGPVSLADLENGVALDCYLNDNLLKNVGTELTGTGNYLLILTDQAGNVTNYQFEIRLYFNLNSWIFIILLLLIIAGVTIYIIFTRRHLRVR